MTISSGREIREEVFLEIVPRATGVVFNLIFRDTGEIRQKKRSWDWVMRRIFFHEIRRWAKNGEHLINASEAKESPHD